MNKLSVFGFINHYKAKKVFCLKISKGYEKDEHSKKSAEVYLFLSPEIFVFLENVSKGLLQRHLWGTIYKNGSGYY